MKILPIIIFLLLAGCVAGPIESLHDGTELVAEVTSESSLDLAATPRGFKIFPSEAYRLVTKGQEQKFSWSIYADRKNYYLVENAPLFITTSAYARMYGVRVNGITGKTDESMEQ
jgi:hypothetical protein